MNDPLIEELAALSHEQWAGWTEWMLKCIESPDREVHIARWRKQMVTPYADLSEKEKESDRVEARKTAKVFQRQVDQIVETCRAASIR